jgi:N4-(beta-N-acetylglucosaminyl)-L-asparaginase
MENWTRRKFFLASLAGSAAAAAGRLFGAASGPGLGGLPAAPVAQGKGTRPLIISAANGVKWLDRGMDVLKKGGDTLDAVLAVVTQVEDDPNDTSVGYGGLPNEDGEVELDASVMHGPTRRAGAVGSLRRIKNPSLVARTVMEKTKHVMIVGSGALRFAQMQGFQPMDLMTDRSRTAWLAWKSAKTDNWAPGWDSPEWKEKVAEFLDPKLPEPERAEMAAWLHEVVFHPPTGTINCCAVNEKGEISGVTTTSGLAWKIAGRVGDSPVIGAGLYVDNDIGAAGSTGQGEENIKVAGGHTIVELMRQGKSPAEACLEAMRRVAHNYNNDKKKLALFSLNFYALNKDGQHGAATLWGPRTPGARGARYAVHDGTEAKLLPCTPLFERVEG